MNFTSAKLWRNQMELTAEAKGSCEMTPGEGSICQGTMEVPKQSHAWFKAVNAGDGHSAEFFLHIDDDTIMKIVRVDPPVDLGHSGRFKFRGIRRVEHEEFARECGGNAGSQA